MTPPILHLRLLFFPLQLEMLEERKRVVQMKVNEIDRLLEFNAQN